MEQPLITIITVCYNSTDTIADTLQSIGMQSYKKIEHLIIDGGSTDGTLEIVRAWREYSIQLVSEPDDGIYDAMNKGIRLAAGDVIGTLNADDVYDNKKVLELVADAFKNESVDICYGDLVYVSRDLSRLVRYWKSSAYHEGLFAKGWVPPHPTFFARREQYRKYGLFNLEYTLAADYELMLRFLHKHNLKPIYLPATLLKMRVGGATNNSLRNIVCQNIEIYKAAKRYGIKVGFSFIIRKIFNRMAQFVRS